MPTFHGTYAHAGRIRLDIEVAENQEKDHDQQRPAPAPIRPMERHRGRAWSANPILSMVDLRRRRGHRIRKAIRFRGTGTGVR